MEICIFKRVEKKYLLSAPQRERLLSRIGAYLSPDEYGKSTVGSLYLDTADFRLIRASIEAVNYKEKLRVRCYGTPNDESRAFFEIKKKFDGVVYKRRIALPYRDVMAYLYLGKSLPPSQIARELDCSMRFYGYPKPMAAIFAEREAFFQTEDPSLRLTFDTGIRYRASELDLKNGTAGIPLLPEGMTLMEIKTGGAMPLWLCEALTAEGIFPTSFSKYGTAYRAICATKPKETTKGVFVYA